MNDTKHTRLFFRGDYVVGFGSPMLFMSDGTNAYGEKCYRYANGRRMQIMIADFEMMDELLTRACAHKAITIMRGT